MAKKKAGKGAKKANGPSMEMLLVGSKTKAALKGHGVNVASDSLDSLNAVVYWYIEQAAKRAGSNGRKTVRGHDFCIM
ncbi:MAG: DUF1931 domain-containing protein [Planctomycetota bacterium]